MFQSKTDTAPQAHTSPAQRPAGAITENMKAKPPASVISADLEISGDIKTTGDIEINGIVEGDIRAHVLTIGENAEVRGELVADDVVVKGSIKGCIRGLKVRLTSTAKVNGDIIHKTIAIESGADFEGSVQRRDNPMLKDAGPVKKAPAPAADVVKEAADFAAAS